MGNRRQSLTSSLVKVCRGFIQYRQRSSAPLHLVPTIIQQEEFNYHIQQSTTIILPPHTSTLSPLLYHTNRDCYIIMWEGCTENQLMCELEESMAVNVINDGYTHLTAAVSTTDVRRCGRRHDYDPVAVDDNIHCRRCRNGPRRPLKMLVRWGWCSF